MSLQQLPAVSFPFVGEFSALAIVAMWASDNKVLRTIRAAFAKWNDVIDVVIRTDLATTPITAPLLRFIQTLYVINCMRTAHLLFFGAAAVFRRSVKFRFLLTPSSEVFRMLCFVREIVSASPFALFITKTLVLIRTALAIVSAHSFKVVPIVLANVPLYLFIVITVVVTCALFNALRVFGVVALIVSDATTFTFVAKSIRAIFAKTKILGSSRKLVTTNAATLHRGIHSASLSLSPMVYAVRGVGLTPSSVISLDCLPIIARKAA